jgi:uncharacterized protein with PIN domain
VLTQFRLQPPWRLFTRCLICNTVLVPAPDLPPQARPTLPAWSGTPSRRHCPQCGRVYWEGQHTERMRAALCRALGAGPVERSH